MTGNEVMYLVYLVPVVMIAFCVFWVIRNIRMGFGKIKIGLTIVESVFVVALSFFLVYVVLNHVNEGADIVKNAHPSSIADITYGQAIDSYCTETSWSRFKNDKEEQIVEANGKAVYKNEESDIKIQFLLEETIPTTGDLSGNFKVRFIGFNDQDSINRDEMINVLYTMFQKYAQENGIALDESAKDGILQSGVQDKSSESPQITEEPEEEESYTEEDAETDSQFETNTETESENDDFYINQVKEAIATGYTTEMTYGDAFDYFFTNPNWAVASDGENIYVKFSGGFVLNQEDCQADIIFEIVNDEPTAYNMTYDHIIQDTDEWLDLRKTVFDSYEEELNNGQSEY